MAEGFARVYGSDVMKAESAGLSPTLAIANATKAAMLEKNIDLSTQFPKLFEAGNNKNVDLIVNMSGFDLPAPAGAPVRQWEIEDPFGKSPKVYARVCQEIENRVMLLILEFRREEKAKAAATFGPGIASLYKRRS